jgi:C-methyltransferase C-terminal domain
MADPMPDPVYPLRLWLCASCGLAQLAEDNTAPEEPRGVEPAALVAQAREAVRQVAKAGLLRPGASVLEYGSPHGGSWLDELTARGMCSVNDEESADVVLDCFGLMHARDQQAALAERTARLAADGILLLQYHTLAAILGGAQWNAVRHGHFAYYSTPVLLEMLKAIGLGAISAWSFDLYGGTVLLAARRGGKADQSVHGLVSGETAAGVRTAHRVRTLQRDASRSTFALRAFLQDARAEGRRVIGYGAASRTVVLLNGASITPDLLPAVVDASHAKHGRRIPGLNIPILPVDSIVSEPAAQVLLFVPDLLDEVRSVLSVVEQYGGRWVLLDPLPRILDAGSGCDEPVSTTLGPGPPALSADGTAVVPQFPDPASPA